MLAPPGLVEVGETELAGKIRIHRDADPDAVCIDAGAHDAVCVSSWVRSVQLHPSHEAPDHQQNRAQLGPAKVHVI